jgi:hypothetical protein
MSYNETFTKAVEANTKLAQEFTQGVFTATVDYNKKVAELAGGTFTALRDQATDVAKSFGFDAVTSIFQTPNTTKK